MEVICSCSPFMRETPSRVVGRLVLFVEIRFVFPNHIFSLQRASTPRRVDWHEASDDVALIHNFSRWLFASSLRLVAWPKAQMNRVFDAIRFASIALASCGERLSVLPDNFS